MKQELSAKGISWINLEEPSNEDLAAFVRDIDLLPVDAEFIVRDHQRPEIAARPAYMLVLIHIPVFEKKLRVTSGAALYILIQDNRLYTLQYQPIVALQKIIKDFVENPEKQEEYFGDSAMSLALHVLSELNLSSFRKIQRLSKHIEIAEDAVFQGNERKMVEEIAILTRDVLDFRRIIKPQLTLFESMPVEITEPATQAQWLRVANQSKQLWEILSSLFDSAKELRDSNDSLLQHKENELLRLLTFYSIIAIPLWIFVTPYNPRQDGATMSDFIVFWGVLSALVITLLIIFLRFKRRRVL